jgi:hypothetical protein
MRGLARLSLQRKENRPTATLLNAQSEPSYQLRAGDPSAQTSKTVCSECSRWALCATNDGIFRKIRMALRLLAEELADVRNII